MKNFINYYYNMNISNIHQKGKEYYFNVNNVKYLFTLCLDVNDIKDIFELNMQLIKQNLPFHQIVLNINNEIVTKFNDKEYILIKLVNIDNTINVNKLIEINNIPISFNKLKRTNWYELWTSKLDYFEYQISQIGKKFPLLRESFNYYLGLGEVAISLIKNIPNTNLYLCLSHKRPRDLNNPLNLIIDYRIRDICEYFKLEFFENKNINNELDIFLNNNNLSDNEKILFISRMLFPTYYFDMYEKIISNEIPEENIKKIIAKINEYEKILHKIYIHFNNNLHIEWLEKINLY